MLHDILRRLEVTFPAEGPAVSAENWMANVPSFCEDFEVQAQRIVAALQMSMPSRLLKESVRELVSTRQPSIVVCEFRLRPQSSYYTRLRQPIPCPENPNGPHATGLELSLALCRGYPSKTKVRRPWLSIEFGVWGEYERARFQDLFFDHRYAVGRLLSSSRLDFETACGFENVDRAKKANALQKLTLYFRNERDAESNFTLSRAIGINDSESDVVNSLLPLAALYDISMGYCLPRPSRARVFDYLALFQE